MPTNEVRRDSARRLREIGKEIGEGALLWYHISKALGVDLTIGGESAANVLADLIEPEPERTCHAVFDDSNWYKWICSECGQPIDRADNYCFSCEAKVIHDELHD